MGRGHFPPPHAPFPFIPPLRPSLLFHPLQSMLCLSLQVGPLIQVGLGKVLPQRGSGKA